MTSRMLLLCTMLAALVTVSVTPANAGYASRVDFTGQSENRYLGSVPAGNISSFGLDMFVTDPARHSGVGLEVKQHENALHPGISLVLPEQEFNLGINMPIVRGYGVRAAVTQQTFLNDSPFASFGVYPYYASGDVGIELGTERDQAKSNFVYVAGKWTHGNGTLFSGASSEYYEEQRATLEKHQYERTGLGYLLSVPRPRVQGLVGGNINWSTGKPTWILGFSRYALVDTSAKHNMQLGVNPAAHLSFRHKPGTDYALAMLALWGQSINRNATFGINEAFLIGAFKTSRIIGGRNFDTPGIGSSYQMQDYGRVSIAASWLNVQAGTTAQLISRDVSGYATYPGSIGPVVNPFIGVTWTEFSDLVYDPVQHRLDDPVQRYWIFKAGGKIRLADRADKRNQLGYLRLGVEVNTHGAVQGKGTVWF